MYKLGVEKLKEQNKKSTENGPCGKESVKFIGGSESLQPGINLKGDLEGEEV